ncbi:MAG: BLUF domain-containing protein [Candidatus Saccharibacteria bacterium]|nr:BLUF domain-containing protein [Pseudorhodobacter sp.]
MLHHIAYVSRSRSPLVPELLSDILDVSAINNTRDGITGILMYHDQLFFQVLEGDHDSVARCFARILDDHRHASVYMMLAHEVKTRAFPDWAMAFCGPDRIAEHTNNDIKCLADLRQNRQTTDSWALKLATIVFHDRAGN